MTTIPSKELRQLISKFNNLCVSRTRRHIRITNSMTGRFVIAPISGSDWRGLKNLERDLRFLTGVKV